MSTYLQISNDLARESGLSGAASSISAVTGQSGQALRVVEWVARAYKDIQNRHNWRWLRSTFTVNTSSGDDTYAFGDCTDSRLSATITRFKCWWPYDENGAPNVKRYLTSGGVGGEGWMTYLPWANFRAIFKIGTQNNGQPVNFTIDPQNNLVLGPKPDGTYTITGEYQMSAQALAADSDTPEFHSDYHDLIVWYALEKYGRFSAAPEALQQAQRESSRLMRQLEATQLPAIGFGGPLA
jgi:hypothetical protein